MKRLFGLMLAALCLSFPAFADDTKMMVDEAYAFATAPAAKSGAAFMTLHNHGEAGERLIGVSTSVAGIAEIHETSMEEGVMQMRKIEGVDIAAGESVMLEPKGLHIMLLDLKQGLALDEEISLTLTFEKAGEIAVPVTVIAPGNKPDAPEAMPEHHHHHH